MDIKEKLKKLKDDESFDDESRDDFKKWIKDIEEFEELKILGKHYLIIRLLEGYAEQIKSLESILKQKRDLKEVERLNIMDRIDLYREFTNIFNVEDKLHLIENKLKEI